MNVMKSEIFSSIGLGHFRKNISYWKR